MKYKQTQTGWATLELILVMPFVVALLFVFLYFAEISYLRLKLNSLVQTATRKAAISNYNCDEVDEILKSNISNQSALHTECHYLDDDMIKISATYTYQSKIPIFELISKEIKTSSIALIEKPLE